MSDAPFDRILAATDLSDSNLPALRYARLFAERFSAGLTVFYTDPAISPVGYLGPEAPYIPTAEHDELLRKQLHAFAAPSLEGREFSVEVMSGQPIPMILDVAREKKIDLIVMGTHLRHGWRRALLGSVSEGVIHGATCPVLTVARDDAAKTMPYAITHVLCPINFTDVARASLGRASRIAAAFSARLTIVHVVEDGEVTNLGADEERVRRWVSPALQNRCEYREVVLRGGPAERVLDCAEDLGADFLVIGAQHQFFRDATVVGTTTERLIRFASCPVLVVPRTAEPKPESGSGPTT
jgi:nucleotide-binding universal stress UspA family protein